MSVVVCLKCKKDFTPNPSASTHDKTTCPYCDATFSEGEKL